jgi:prepilin-type N-terminal cleavage/methylation domain-containing protein
MIRCIRIRSSKCRPAKAERGSGFTLVEILVVLVLLSILGSIAVQRVIALDTTAVRKSFECAVNELNSRECLTWSKVKTSTTLWVNDEQVHSKVDRDLGTAYSWSALSPEGGSLKFRNETLFLERSPSTALKPGRWGQR